MPKAAPSFIGYNFYSLAFVRFFGGSGSRVALIGLELTFLLPQPLEAWDYLHVLSVCGHSKEPIPTTAVGLSQLPCALPACLLGPCPLACIALSI